MISYSFYKKYNKGNLFGYIGYSFKYFFNYVIHTIYSCYLCIRFPFLYPRNRWTNKHYNNWKLNEKKCDIYKKWSEYANNNIKTYLDEFGDDALYSICEKDYVKPDYVMKLASKKDKFLYWFYGFYHTILEIIHFIPTSNELDAMDKGWKKKFGIDLCKDLKMAILEDCGWLYMLKSFRIIQIKEKNGSLVFDVNNYTPNVSKIISHYEMISEYVCIECGDWADRYTIGYICPYCEKCYNDNFGVFKYIHPSNDEQIKHNESVDEMIDKC